MARTYWKLQMNPESKYSILLMSTVELMHDTTLVMPLWDKHCTSLFLHVFLPLHHHLAVSLDSRAMFTGHWLWSYSFVALAHKQICACNFRGRLKVFNYTMKKNSGKQMIDWSHWGPRKLLNKHYCLHMMKIKNNSTSKWFFYGFYLSDTLTDHLSWEPTCLWDIKW